MRKLVRKNLFNDFKIDFYFFDLYMSNIKYCMLKLY